MYWYSSNVVAVDALLCLERRSFSPPAAAFCSALLCLPDGGNVGLVAVADADTVSPDDVEDGDVATPFEITSSWDLEGNAGTGQYDSG